MFRRRAEPGGFTLLEVLIALVVLALALVALTRTAARQTAAFSALQDRALAGWVAANALTEARLETGMPPTGVSEGRVEMAGRSWEYRITVSDTPASGIRRLHVEVFAPSSTVDASALLSLDGFAGRSLGR